MPLIKANQAPLSLQPFSMADVEAAAKRVLLRARQQAEQLLLDAQNEAEALKEQAKAEGFQEGLDEGRAEGLRLGKEAGHAQALAEHREQFTHTIAALSAAAAELDAGRQRLEADGLREVVRLAAAIARRVTKRQGLIDEEVLAANVAEAMRLVIHAADVQIAVHPSQRSTLEAALPHLRTEWPSLKHVDLIDDATLAPGGCRIAARGGQVDAALDTQLDRVIADLLPAVEER